MLRTFVMSFKERLQREAGEEHGWEDVPRRTTQNLHGSVPWFPDCFPHPAANGNYMFTQSSLHPRHHSQPLPYMAGGSGGRGWGWGVEVALLFPFYK